MEKKVFIIGSKGIPAQYGGYETFVEQLTKRKTCKDIMYYVSCMNQNCEEMLYNDALCFSVKVPNFGPAKAIYYDFYSFKKCLKYIKDKKIKNGIIYVLTCRIGPFFNFLVKKAHKLGAKVYLNPDGHEWMRSKWSFLVRKYWKVSEKIMVSKSDLIICDSINIQKYIKNEYSKYNPNTTFIAYGASLSKSKLLDDDEKFLKFIGDNHVCVGDYYLIVGRFVPENNYEIIIREFMNSTTKKDLVIITNVENNKLYKTLKQKYNFEKDKRIKFVGTIYDEELLKKIRENAYAYIHGHSVGGTNPSLLESLSSTKVNILYDVGFNKECGSNGALYFNREKGNLAKILEKSEKLSKDEIFELDNKSTNQVATRYNWPYIIERYEKLFLED